MSASPIITFKAGICEIDSNNKVKPQSTPGYLYLYSEDDLVHFCWRPRGNPHTDPELDLVMVPEDGSFVPYEPAGKAPTNGRIYALKFSSSSQRYLFYLQSQSQHENGDLSWFSPRDVRLGEIVNSLLQGEELDMEQELANLPRGPSGGSGGDDDETMEDVEGVDHDTSHNHGGGGSGGGAGPGATGGDIREEGQGSRDGGADGGRATNASADPSSVVQGFLSSLQGGSQNEAAQGQGPFTTLQDLLTPSFTISFVDSADNKTVDSLLSFLPPSLLLLAQNVEDVPTDEVSQDIVEAVMMSLSLSQKKDILRKVLRSPQFMQSLASLTVALRDGGLPSISEALGIPVEHGGYMRRGGVPLGGGDAVKAFVEGTKKHVKDKHSDQGNRMETD